MRRLAIATMFLVLMACGHPKPKPTATDQYCHAMNDALAERDRIKSGTDLATDAVATLRPIQLRLEAAQHELEREGKKAAPSGQRAAASFVADARRILIEGPSVPNVSHGLMTDAELARGMATTSLDRLGDLRFNLQYCDSVS